MYGNEEDYEEQEVENGSSGNKLMDFYYNNKKLVWILLGVIILLLIGSLVTKKSATNKTGDSNITLSSIRFDDGVVVIGKGYRMTLNVIKDPLNGYAYNTKFTSSDSSIVKVDNKGVIEAVGNGKATITLTSNDNKFKSTKDVYVGSEWQVGMLVNAPDEVLFTDSPISITVNQVLELSYELSPRKAEKSLLKWSSENENCVKVRENGFITGIAVGSTYVVAKSALNNEVIGKVLVNVKENTIEVTDISVPLSIITLKPGDSQKITPTITPTDATNKNLTCKSTNDTIARCETPDGGRTFEIFGYTEGSVTVTLESSNGVKKELTITVSKNASNVSPSPNNPGSPSYPSGPSGCSCTAAPDRSGRNYGPSSKDKNGGSYLVNCCDNTGSGNAATGYLNITFTLDSGIDALKICHYKKGSSECTPNKEVKNGGSYKISENGTWVIKISEYKNGTKKRGPDYWYTTIKDGTGNDDSNSEYTISGCTSLRVGNTCTLSLKKNGNKITSGVTWSTLSTSLISLNTSTGVVTGKNASSMTKATVYAKVNGNQVATIEISVVDVDRNYEIKNSCNNNIESGGTCNLILKNSSGQEIGNVKWSLSPTSILISNARASVDSNGKVTAIDSSGNITVYARVQEVKVAQITLHITQ